MGTTPADLGGCIARVDWATKALHTLNEKTRVWILENDPYSTAVEYHPEADVHVFRLATEAVPVAFGIVTGNIVHQARAALDNLVWQLVILNGGKPRGGMRGNAFPILLPKHDHHAFAKNTKNTLSGVHPDHRTLIEGLQPYQRPDGIPPDQHPLAVLAGLSNTDKHQVLELMRARAGAEHLSVDFRGKDIQLIVNQAWEPLPELKAGAIVGWVQVTPSGFHPDMHMEIGGLARIIFSGGEPLVPCLRVLVSSVEAIVSAFLPAMVGLQAIPVGFARRDVNARFEAHRKRDPLTGIYGAQVPNVTGRYPFGDLS